MTYLDNAATTACAAPVVEAMLPFFTDNFANAASSDHKPGNDAKMAVDQARSTVAALVNANPEDVVFTSGSTESNNLALSVNSRLLTTPVEHPSILDAMAMRRFDQDAFLTIDSNGAVDLNMLRTSLDDQIETLVSVIATNNETGLEQDILGIAKVVNITGSMLHIDATQSIGTQEINMAATPSLAGVSLSAHKIHGPKGVGALIVSAALRRKLQAVHRGGGHERGLRSGTLNVPGIVGFGVAVNLLSSCRAERRSKLHRIRQGFLHELRSRLDQSIVVESLESSRVSPHILSLRFSGTNGRALLRALRDDVAFSLGSACATNKNEPSHVLTALGFDKRQIAETVRFSFAYDQTENTVRLAASRIAAAVRALSDFSLTV